MLCNLLAVLFQHQLRSRFLFQYQIGRCQVLDSVSGALNALLGIGVVRIYGSTVRLGRICGTIARSRSCSSTSRRRPIRDRQLGSGVLSWRW